MDTALSLVEAGFRSLAAGTAVNEPRRRVRAPGGALLHLMGAAENCSGHLGAKVYSTSSEGARFFILLFDSHHGRPLALIEADYLGQMRTGAASGVATRLMARPESAVLAVIGAGLQAWTQVLAISRVRRLREVRVSSRTPARQEQFAERVTREIGIPARAVSETRQAIRGADMVVTATTARDPVLLGEWLEEGMHINAVGSNAATRREVDEAAVRRADVIVVDHLEQSKIESGELIAAPRWDEVVELAQVVAGHHPGRSNPQEITLFKSNGIALEDVVVAGWLYEKAKEPRMNTD